MINLSSEYLDKIKSRFGEKFTADLSIVLKRYTELWGLTKLEPTLNSSASCVFFCHAEHFGDVVLKIRKPCKESICEFNTLKEYNGKLFCRIFDADPENGVILEERILPGVELWSQPPKTRISVFLSLHGNLHIKPKNEALYPRYIDWVSNAFKNISSKSEYKELSLHMKKSKCLCLKLNEKYSRKMLLHGDFHHGNILSHDSNEYRIIDPKGVIADPIFDIPRFILNEIPVSCPTGTVTEKDVLNIIGCFANALGISSGEIMQCYFIEATMAECWRVEDNQRPNMAYINFLWHITSKYFGIT